VRKRFIYIVMRITFDASLQAEFDRDPAAFVDRLDLTAAQRAALLSKDVEKINIEISRELSAGGAVPEIKEPLLNCRSWPVHPSWPVHTDDEA